LISPFWRGLTFAAVTALLAGCGSSSTLRLYVLGSPARPTIGVWSEADLPVIELKTVSVPDYLDSSDILRRVGPNEVAASPTGRWGERLSVGLTQALASELSSRLPKVVIAMTPPSGPTRRLFVDIERFDIEADGQCLVTARWRITAGDGQTTSESEHGAFREAAASTDDPAIASAMTRAVDQLADRIAATIEREQPPAILSSGAGDDADPAIMRSPRVQR
jgi:hypothetical protein